MRLLASGYSMACVLVILSLSIVFPAAAQPATTYAKTITTYEYVDTSRTYEHGEPTRTWIEYGVGDFVAGTGTLLSETTYGYDDAGNRTLVLCHASDDALDEITEYEYLVSGQIEKTSQTGPNGTVVETTNVYDKIGRLASVVRTGGGENAYYYDASGNLTRQCTKLDDSAYAVVETEHDALGRPTKITDPEGHWREVKYDSMGREIRIEHFASDATGLSKREWFYDKVGRMTRDVRYADRTDSSPDVARDEVFEYSYDNDGRRMTTTTYHMNTSTPLLARDLYDDIGRLTKRIDAMSCAEESRYDDRGKLTQRIVTDGLGSRAFTYDYDAGGRITTETAEGVDDVITRYEYDGLDRIVAKTDGEGMVTAYDYDLLGHQVRVTEDAGGLARATDSIYDRLGRLIGLVAYDGTAPSTIPISLDDGGTAEPYEVDADGAGVQLTVYDYDAAGRRTGISYPPSTSGSSVSDVITFAYDLAGRMTSKTDQRQDVTLYEYDSCGLLLTRQSANGTTDEYRYDGAGRMTRAERTDNGTAISVDILAYDDLGRLTQESQSLFGGTARVVQYDYDQASNRIRFDYPSDANVALTYTYDNLNRVDTAMRAVGGGAAMLLIDYDYEGHYVSTRRVATADDPAGYVRMEYGWDEHRRQNEIVSVLSIAGGATLAQHVYQFDKAGNRTSTTGTGWGASGTVAYGYDSLHRLTSADYDNQGGDYLGTELFNYDLLGNRDRGGAPYGYSDSRAGGVDVEYGANGRANEYSAIDGVTMEYDDAGNLTRDEVGLIYEYDRENRLTAIRRD